MLKSNNYTIFDIIKKALLFTAIYAIFTLLLVAFSSLILLKTKDPLNYISYVSKGISLFSAFITAFILAKKLGERCILSGIILGTAIIAILLLLFLIMGEKGDFNPLIYVATIVATTFGSILGQKRIRRKKPKHKRK